MIKSLKSRLNPLSFLIITITAVLISCFLVIIDNPKSAHAVINLNPNPNGYVPGYIYNNLRNSDSLSRYPAVESWLSERGNYANQSITVAQGQTSVGLSLNWAGVVNRVPNQASYSREIVHAVSGGSFSGSFVGSTRDLPWGNLRNTLGTYMWDKSDFNFTPPGGSFTNSGIYTINVHTKSINQFTNSAGQLSYRCIGGNGVATTSISNFAPCNGTVFSLSIFITVEPGRYEVKSYLRKAGGGQFTGNCNTGNGAGYTFGNDASGNQAQHSISTTNGSSLVDSCALDLIKSNINPDKSTVVHAPGSIYTNKGQANEKRWRNYEGNMTFTSSGQKIWYYECTEGCGGPPPPSCDNPLTFFPPSPISGPGNVTVYWSSSDNDSGVITDNSGSPVPLIGPLGPVGSPTDRLFGSKSVFISTTTTFTGRWSRENKPDAVCTGTIAIGPGGPSRKPILKVTGNDVQAGAIITTDASKTKNFAACTPVSPTPDGDIETVIPPTPSSGSTGQYAVSASGRITGFQGDNKSGGSNDLTFNNNNLLQLGGYSVICRLDLAQSIAPDSTDTINTTITKPAPTTAKQIIKYDNGNSNQNYTLSNNPAIGFGGAPTIPAGVNRQRLTIIVDGNVQINNNISYDTNYGNRSGIPSFALIATGNIYVAEGVNQLDGLYVSNRTFSTCSNGSTLFNPALTKDTCKNQLTINGALVANEVYFRRTKGNVGDPTPAEQLSFLPELYLSPPPSTSTLVDLTRTGFLDLPPVF